MKRLLVVAIALALVAACTDQGQNRRSTMSAAEVRKANHLPLQRARVMASPYDALGCLWDVPLTAVRIAAPNELSATCAALAAGQPFTVRVEGNRPSAEADPDARMRLAVSGPGFAEEMLVALSERRGDRLRFGGAAHGRVPNGGAVALTLGLIGCEDDSGRPIACPLEAGALFVLTRHN